MKSVHLFFLLGIMIGLDRNGGRAVAGSPDWIDPAFTTALAISPQGKMYISASGTNGYLDLRYLANGKQVPLGPSHNRRLGKVGWHGRAVFSVVFSPDGKQALSGGEGGLVKLWEVGTGRLIRTFRGLRPPKTPGKVSAIVSCLALSPDGRFCLGGGALGMLKLWSVKSGKVVRNFVGHRKRVTAVAFSPNSRQILSGSSDAGVKLWDVRTGKVIRTYSKHDGGVRVVAFNPNGRSALAATERVIKLWVLSNGKTFRTFSVARLMSISSASFSPSGRYMVSGGGGGVRLWEIATGKVVLTIAQAQLWKGGMIAVTPNGRKALSSDGHCIVLWDLTNGEEIRTLEGPPSEKPPLNWVAFSPNGKLALSAGMADTTDWEDLGARANRTGKKLHFSRGIITLWEVKKGRKVRTFRGHEEEVIYAAFTPDGSRIFSAAKDNSFRIWQVSTGRTIRTWKEVDSSLCRAVLSHDGRQALSGGHDQLKLWDLGTGKLIHTLRGHKRAVTFAAFFKAGKRALSGVETFPEGSSPEPVIKVWDLKTGKYLKTVKKVGHPLALSENGERLLSRAGKVWDLTTGQLVRSLRDGEDWIALTAVFSPNGKQILSGHEDGVIKLWNVTSGKRARSFWSKGVPEAVRRIAFSPDGKRALACGDGRRVKLWDLVTGKEIRSFVTKKDW